MRLLPTAHRHPTGRKAITVFSPGLVPRIWAHRMQVLRTTESIDPSRSIAAPA
ncbi:MAG TPA: hypothetical protein VIY28_17260 [Pseudonocardiaceae bacterium]